MSRVVGFIHGFKPRGIRLVPLVKAEGRISLADAYAIALAHGRDATLVAGADDDFDELPIDVDLRRFRDHGV